MTPLLSGLPGNVASISDSAPAPAPAVDVPADVSEQPALEYAEFAANLDPVVGELPFTVWPVPDSWQETSSPEQRPSAEELGAEAEQWLANIFGQLDTQLQVREGPLPGREAAGISAAVTGAVTKPPTPRGTTISDQVALQIDDLKPGLEADAVVEGKPQRARDPEGVAQLLVQKSESAPVELSRAVAQPPVAAIGSVSAVASHDASAPLPVTSSERSLNLAQVPQAQWGERMIGALRDSVELQFRNGLQQATIRLDPAELGRVEIQVSHEAGRLHVQIQAGQGDVVRLLQQTSERLRQELAGQHFVEVSVQVGADSQQERRGRQAPSSWVSEPAVQVSHLVEDDSAAGDSRRSDVLITV